MQQQSPLKAQLSRSQSARSLQGSGLGICFRFSLLRRQSDIVSRRKEEGASLVVALVAAFVLLLGVGALATRTNFGFMGQAFQAQNRQARDMAESAISEFADTMNQEPYRHLLIAGTTNNWTPSKIASDFTNICTAFDKTTDAVSSSGTVAPANNVYSAFRPGAVLQDRGSGRSFRVESIEFLTESRTAYVDNSGEFLTDPSSGSSYGVVYRSGGARSLIRITVVGQVNQNGRISQARVAREFEVVPKCCNRSFGANTIGGVNWGRDSRSCLSPGGRREPGLISGMGGGIASGSGNSKPIIKEDGTPVTQAACWNGNVSGQTSVLTGTPNSSCANNISSIGNISFSPSQFSFNPPEYDHPAGTITAQAVPINADGVIYFDPSKALNSADLNPHNRSSGLVLLRGVNITRINGAALDANSPDPCYIKSTLDPSQRKPYATVNCLITNINPGGNNKIYIDTSLAKINMFYAGNGDYGIGAGNAGTFRVHSYRADLATSTSNDCVTTSPSSACLIQWPNVSEGSSITAADRIGTFLELCSDRSYNCDPTGGQPEEFAVRNLLNFYTQDPQGSGNFSINGNTSGLGFNIYAPNATVRMNGVVNADNFMGQVWTNNLIINGNISIRTFSGGGVGSAPGTLSGIPLIDFVVRSST